MNPITVAFALLLLIVASQIVGAAFQAMRQPRVIGEILGGVIFGPSAIGALYPDFYHSTFGYVGDPQARVLAFAAWLGLVLLMFCAGLESRTTASREEWRGVGWLAALILILPMGVGVGLANVFDFTPFMGPHATPWKFSIILGMSLAVTAIPVISKILLDLGIEKTPFARVILGVAFVEDLAMWVALSLTLGLGEWAGRGPLAMVYCMFALGTFVAYSLLAGSRLYDSLARLPFSPLSPAEGTTGPVVTLLAMSLLANAIGASPIFGAYLAGHVVAHAETVSDDTRNALRRFAFGLFVPVFFARVGLRLDLLRADFSFAAFGGLLVVAMVTKTIAVLLGARLAGFGRAAGIHLAMALNARGAMGVVLATIALDAGLITGGFHTVLVLVALVSTLFAGWWLDRVVHARPHELVLRPDAAPAPSDPKCMATP